MGKWFRKWFGWLFGKKRQDTLEDKLSEESNDAGTLDENDNKPVVETEPKPISDLPVHGDGPTEEDPPIPESQPKVPVSTEGSQKEDESSGSEWEIDVPPVTEPVSTGSLPEVQPPDDPPAVPSVPPTAVNPFEDSTAGIEVKPDEVLRVTIQRYSFGQADTLGRLLINGHFCCFTLEGVSTEGVGKDLQCIPSGQYPLALRKSGGKHATYFFRHKDIHKGMLWIQGVEDFDYAQIHEGNNFTDIPGSIIVGEQPLRENQLDQKRELWYSEHAYREIYPLIANHISSGGMAILSIN